MRDAGRQAAPTDEADTTVMPSRSRVTRFLEFVRKESIMATNSRDCPLTELQVTNW